MKHNFKFFIGLFLFTAVLTSCSTDNEEISEVNALDAELALENKGALVLESTTYIFKATGETAKFQNETREFDFNYVDEILYTATRSTRHAGEELLLTNPETNEFIRFIHLEELKNGSIKFDLELSTGQKFESVIFKPGKGFSNDAQKWHGDPMLSASSPLVGAVIELSQQDVNSHCTAAITACSRAGGKPTVAIAKGAGWFTAPQNCSVTCN